MTTFYKNAFVKTKVTRFQQWLLLVILSLSFHTMQAQCDPDVTPPIAICDALINVSLSGDGTATIFAETIDDGSYDACCLGNLLVKRELSTCLGYEDNLDFGPAVTFCCEDISTTVTVVLQVADCDDNTNLCWTTIAVEDKLVPFGTCPADTTITCNFYDGLSQNGIIPDAVLDQNFGEAVFFDNCNVTVSQSHTIDAPNACSDFTHIRTWTGQDDNPTNATATCNQVITILMDGDLIINFPADTTFNCSTGSISDAGEPEIVNESCSVAGVAYEDIVLTLPSGIIKILRTWTVVNWCTAEVYEHVQVIEYTDDEVPVLSCADPLTFYTDSNTDLAMVNVPAPDVSDCSGNPTIVASSDLPNFNAITFSAIDVTEGVYTVTFTVTDDSGNQSTCAVDVMVATLNSDCPADTTADCTDYLTTIAPTLSQLTGASQNDYLDQFYGAPNFQNGANIISEVTINVDACGQGTLVRTWSLDDGSTPNLDGFALIASNEIGLTTDEVCVDVSVQGFENLLSMQFSMAFDPTVLAFQDVQNSILDDGAFGTTGAEEGQLVFVWFDSDLQGVTLPDETTIFQVCFTAIGETGTASPFSFENTPTPFEIINTDEVLLDYETVTGSVLINGMGNGTGGGNGGGNGGGGNGGDCLLVSAPNVEVGEGENICIPVTVEDFNGLLSFQYSMNFDETVLAYDQIVDPENLNDITFGDFDVANGNITVSWFDLQLSGVQLADGTVLYEVCFEVIGAIGDMSAFSFSGSPTAIEVVDSNEEEICLVSNPGQILVNMNEPNGLVANTLPTVLCTQVVSLENNNDWTVVFPPDTLVACNGNTLEAGEPLLTNNGCALLATAYEDVILLGGSTYCYKVLRTWTVINWCDGNIQTHTQVIEVNDTIAPVFVNNCELPTISLNTNAFECVGEVSIPMPVTMDCSSDVTLEVTSELGLGFGPFQNVGIGSYMVTFTATDPCGNTTVCVSSLNVVDDVAPIAICDESIQVALGNNGEATLFAATIDDGSYDNCGDVTLSFSAAIDDQTITFDCDNVGENILVLWVIDEAGNTNNCLVSVTVNDLLGNCDGDPCDELTNLVCNNFLQVSLSANGTTAIQFDYILEGIQAGCIDSYNLSFSADSEVEFLVFDCNDIGSHIVTVYDLDTGNSCWGTVAISDPGEFCGDPNSCNPDLTPPTPYCYNGLVVNLLSVNDPNNNTFEPMIEVFSVDLDAGSFDLCSDVTLSFSTDVNEWSTIFTCNDIGVNTVQVWVTDTAGNQDFCEANITVQGGMNCDSGGNCAGDEIAPVPVCENGLITTLALTTPAAATVWAQDFDEGSYDNCSTELLFSFSSDINNQTTTFDCDDLGAQPVTIYVTDENGNQDFCSTFIIIQDNLGACSASGPCDDDIEAPLAFCASGLVIQMPPSAAVTLNASIFDVGSTDNCTEDLNLMASIVDNDGNVIQGPAAALVFNIDDIGANNVVLTVTDEAGNSSECSTILLLQSNPPKVITGKIFIDDNEDCLYDVGEQGLNTWQVKLEAIDDPLATDPGIVILPPSYEIDAEGNYSIVLPDDFVFFTPDSSVVNINNLNPYLRVSLATGFNYGQDCDYNYFINSATNILDTIAIDFPVQIIDDCPQLSVDVSTPFLRRCFDNNYYINYCNFGSIAVDDVVIEVEFDDYLEVNSSSVPWSAVTDNIYTFDLGTVEAAACGDFQVNVTVSCDAVLGQTHCTYAHISPDTLCAPASPQWSGASIQVDGECEGDVVKFTITNIGDNDMDSEAQYIVIEDFVMYNTGTFELNAGESTVVEMPANGSTWRLEADQSIGHPGKSKPSYAVEGCSIDGNFSLGMVNLFPQNDNDPIISVNCMENIGSFDPNDKLALPTGYDEDHFIKRGTEIEYLIRFQNTGSDTAFNVVLIDTLDVNLDPLSVRAGGSSHAYDFTLLGNNVLKFNFDNIALPDSSANEAASHGYVKFRVEQKPELPIGTVIENTAAIYFDFNEPIITNLVYHTIGENFIEEPNSTFEPTDRLTKVTIYPNPFDEEANVEITGLKINQGDFLVFDLNGRLIQSFKFTDNKFKITGSELPSGIYFYQIVGQSGLVNSGKLVIQ